MHNGIGHKEISLVMFIQPYYLINDICTDSSHYLSHILFEKLPSFAGPEPYHLTHHFHILVHKLSPSLFASRNKVP